MVHCIQNPLILNQDLFVSLLLPLQDMSDFVQHNAFHLGSSCAVGLPKILSVKEHRDVLRGSSVKHAVSEIFSSRLPRKMQVDNLTAT